MTSKNAVSTVKTNKNKKKPLEVLSEFKMEVAKALFNQRVLSELAAAFIDAKCNKGWNQNDIAKRIKMNPTQLSRLMSGRQSNIETDTLALIALAMEYEPCVELKSIDYDKEVRPHSDIMRSSKLQTYLQKEYIFAERLHHASLENKDIADFEEEEDTNWVSGETVHPSAMKLFDHVS